jgi:hypothetical protein
MDWFWNGGGECFGYESMETTLRVAVLKAIEDDKFSSILSDWAEIKKRWPV